MLVYLAAARAQECSQWFLFADFGQEFWCRLLQLLLRPSRESTMIFLACRSQDTDLAWYRCQLASQHWICSQPNRAWFCSWHRIFWLGLGTRSIRALGHWDQGWPGPCCSICHRRPALLFDWRLWSEIPLDWIGSSRASQLTATKQIFCFPLH